MNSTRWLSPSSFARRRATEICSREILNAPNGHSIVFGHVEGQSAPAAACFHDTLPRLELHLAGKRSPISRLAACSSVAPGDGIISAGIDELRVEPELVKIGIKIVVAAEYFDVSRARSCAEHIPMHFETSLTYSCDARLPSWRR